MFKGTIKVLHRPIEYKENEIPQSSLKQIEHERPCGILTEDKLLFSIIRQSGALITQNLQTLEIIEQNGQINLFGAIESVRKNHGLKDVLLFEDGRALKKWANRKDK